MASFFPVSLKTLICALITVFYAVHCIHLVSLMLCLVASHNM